MEYFIFFYLLGKKLSSVCLYPSPDSENAGHSTKSCIVWQEGLRLSGQQASVISAGGVTSLFEHVTSNSDHVFTADMLSLWRNDHVPVFWSLSNDQSLTFTKVQSGGVSR